MGPYDSAHQVAELTRQVRAIGADLDAERRSRYDSDRDAARLREKLERVTSDLARVEAERDEAMAALEGASNALGGLELYELSETAGHVETVVADRDEALADLARVEAERDEARADIGRLTAERDARPAITREDAAIYRHATGEGSSALWRVERALAAHAKGAE